MIESSNKGVVEQRVSLIQALQTKSDFQAAVRYLREAQASVTGLHYRNDVIPSHYYGTFFSLKVADAALARERRLYSFLNSLELSCAPRLQEQFRFIDKGGCSLLSLEGIPKEGIPRPESQRSDSKSDLSSAAVEAFIDDLEKLADAGWYHPWVTENSEHWHLHPVSGRVLVFAWDCIRCIEAGEKENIRQDIATLCLEHW